MSRYSCDVIMYWFWSSGLGEVWTHGHDQLKFDQFGWRCTNKENSYSSDTVVGNWNEEKYDVKEQSKAKPLPSAVSIWAASHKKVPNVPSCCDTKRRMDMLSFFLSFFLFLFDKSVSYQKKDAATLAHPSFGMTTTQATVGWSLEWRICGELFLWSRSVGK